MSNTVLIGSSEHLPALQKRDGLNEATAFADTDALRALDAITRDRPDIVAIEREFATTSRGAALIDRINADPRLTACEIQVISFDSDNAHVAPPHVEGATPAAMPASMEAVPAAVLPLDQRGTRREPRFKIVEGVEVRIDGKAVSLVNLSTIGAQVISPMVLKPNQHTRFTLMDPPRLTRGRAAVAWASFEIPKGVALYRAGLEFVDVNQAALTRFIKANKAKPKGK